MIYLVFRARKNPLEGNSKNMITEKYKALTQKKKIQKQKEREEEIENIQSMRSWIRKIEQSTNSISSRLAAVEKRLSGRKFDSDSPMITGNMMEGPIERIFVDLKEAKKDKEIEELSRLLDTEFQLIQDEIVEHKKLLSEVQEKLEVVNESQEDTDVDVKHVHKLHENFKQNYEARLQKIEKYQPAIMKLGKMEVPLEIAGVIAGVLAIIAAIFVAVGWKSLLISPYFLAIIGLVFIGSAFYKTLKINNRSIPFLPKILKMLNGLVPKRDKVEEQK